MNIIRIHELSQGGWFILSAMIALVFINIAWSAWRELGYKASETRAAIALATFFFASAAARLWNWLVVWLPMHGYPEMGGRLYGMLWWPILTNLAGVVGALCAVRVFYPLWTRKRMISPGASWLIPLIVALLFLLITSLI